MIPPKLVESPCITSPPVEFSNGSRAIRGAFLFLHRASGGLAAAAGAGVKVLGRWPEALHKQPIWEW